MTTPGRRYLRGHHQRRMHRRDLSTEGMIGKPRAELIEELELEPIVSRCAHCPWTSALLPVLEAVAAFRAHTCTAA